MMGLPADAITESVAVPSAKPADLVPRTFIPRVQRIAEQTYRRLVYVLITATIAVPVWLATRSHLDSAADIVSLDNDVAVPAARSEPPAAANRIETAPAAQPAPLVASITPMPQRAVPTHDLAISFSDESWVRVSAPDGSVVEQALVAPGQQRVFAMDQIGKAVLGNAQAVSVRYRGQPVDLTPYIRANVVRFTVSSEGYLQPVDR
jgi:cytoskeleton protein RodZ